MYLLNNEASALTAQGLVNANCNYDGFVDSTDSTLIMNYVGMLVESSNLGPQSYGLNELKWNMSAEEGKELVTLDLASEEHSDTSYGGKTNHVYENVQFYGYTADLILCYVDGVGLNGVNYRIKDDVYDEIYLSLYEKFGGAENHAPSNSTWYPENKNYYIFLAEYNDESGNTITKFSFFPVD